jgi:hypothetical protein
MLMQTGSIVRGSGSMARCDFLRRMFTGHTDTDSPGFLFFMALTLDGIGATPVSVI